MFLVRLLFGCIYMNSSNLSCLFLDIEIFVVSNNGNSPCTPGTCTAVLCRVCQFYLKKWWMTLGLFFTPIYPSYDPTGTSPFNFLNFHSDTLIFHLLFFAHHSDTLICHLLFLCPPFIQTTPPTARCGVHQGDNPVGRLLWQPWEHLP